MCYSVYLSTTSDLDLSGENSDLIRFRKMAADEPFGSMLQHEHKWYVGSKSGCSCTFRHLTSVELGFSEPVDWYEEAEDEILATRSLIMIVRKLIDRGDQVDCIDVWYGAAEEDIVEKTVNLHTLEDEQFRFFENYHFRFVNQARSNHPQ